MENPMKIAIGNDHAGVRHKENIKKLLESMGHVVTDTGTGGSDGVDYPDYARMVGLAVCRKEADLGILICGTGIGMSLAANKVKDIRAAVCWNEDTARLARQHNNANILCMGARFISIEDSLDITRAFLETEFSNEERHIRRVNKIMDIEERRGSCD
jgi:ribose 5-phosphate isomerase B